MNKQPFILKHPELREFFYLVRYEIQKAQRPPHEIIYDDEDVMRILKISKRNLQYLKANGVIPFHYFEPEGTRTYYLLSDILQILKENRVEAFFKDKRIE